MAELLKEFAFEEFELELKDGTRFSPLRDAISRNSKGWSTQAGMDVYRFLIVYELPRSQFILAEYSPCTKQIERRGAFRRKVEFWEAPHPPRAEPIELAEAYNLFIVHWPEQPLPEPLKVFEASLPLVDAPANTSVRPLEYWSKPHLPIRLTVPAHVAATLDNAASLFIALLRFNQLLRMWTDIQVFPNLTLLHSLTGQLLGVYPVDPKHWPEGKKMPKAVTILDLPWPEHLQDVKRCLEGVRLALAEPLWCFACRMLPADSPYRPSWDELEIAIAELRSRANPLEQLLGYLEQSIGFAEMIEEMRLRDAEHEALHGDPVDRRRAGDQEPYRPSDLKVYATWRYALASMQVGDKSIRPSDAYKWLTEYGCGAEFGDYQLPEYENWRRQLNRVRNFIKRTGYDPLGGGSSSVVDPDSI